MTSLLSLDGLSDYNRAMEQSLADKLFFLDHIPEAAVYVDFGCANGALLAGIAARRRIGWQGYGVDNNQFQLACAAQKFPAGIYAADFEDIRDRVADARGIKVAIFSSVVHEAPQLINQASGFDYIVIRDMGVTEAFARSLPSAEVAGALAKSRTYARMLEQRGWEAGDYEVMDVATEFFLKEPYLNLPRSRDRELGEKYPLVGIDGFLAHESPDRYGLALIHFEHYSLPYIRERIQRDHGIDFPYPTHFKAILKKVT